jgi:hypothetical protein
MTGNYWILRHPDAPGVVCAISAELVADTPALLDLPTTGMAFENVEIITLEEFLARTKAAQK